jgi:hypothetical protein
MRQRVHAAAIPIVILILSASMWAGHRCSIGCNQDETIYLPKPPGSEDGRTL